MLIDVTVHQEACFKALPEELQPFIKEMLRITEEDYMPPSSCATGLDTCHAEEIPQFFRQMLTYVRVLSNGKGKTEIEKRTDRVNANDLMHHTYQWLRTVYSLSKENPIFVDSSWSLWVLDIKIVHQKQAGSFSEESLMAAE